jgi:hypothetical protein
VCRCLCEVGDVQRRRRRVEAVQVTDLRVVVPAAVPAAVDIRESSGAPRRSASASPFGTVVRAESCGEKV